MNIELNIPDTRITDLLHGHGGSLSPWLHQIAGEWKDVSCVVNFDKEDEEEGVAAGNKTINREEVKAGLIAMAHGSSWHFAQFLNEQDDDVTFDIAWQYIIFGKLVYA